MPRVDLTLQSLWMVDPLQIELACPVVHFSPSWPTGFEVCPERPDGVYFPIVPGGAIACPGFGSNIHRWFVRPRLRIFLPVATLANPAFSTATGAPSAPIASNSTIGTEQALCPITISSEPVWTVGNGEWPFTGFEMSFPTTAGDPAAGALPLGNWAPFGVPRNQCLVVKQRVYVPLTATFANRRYHLMRLQHPTALGSTDNPQSAAGLFETVTTTLDQDHSWVESRLIIPGPLSPMDYLGKSTRDHSGGVTAAAQIMVMHTLEKESYRETSAVELRARLVVDARAIGAPITARCLMVCRGLGDDVHQIAPGGLCRGVGDVAVTSGTVNLNSLSATGSIIDSKDLSAGALAEVNPSPDGLYEIYFEDAVYPAAPSFTVWQL